MLVGLADSSSFLPHWTQPQIHLHWYEQPQYQQHNSPHHNHYPWCDGTYVGLITLFLSPPAEEEYSVNENERVSPTFSKNCNDFNRRRVVTTTATSWMTTIHSGPYHADATVDTSNSIVMSDTTTLYGLQQYLPSYDPTTTVRLFLCRHGETDYNRNHMIQGARIDPPINERGMEQAKLLGQTLYHTILRSSSSITTSNQPQTQQERHNSVIIAHSPLRRAKQTAEWVAEPFRHMKGTSQQSVLPQLPQQPLVSSTTALLRPLEGLAEVDFGSMAEGAPIHQYRTELWQLYTAWAVGKYNARMSAGGESGIEVTYHFRSTFILCCCCMY
jgi:broad specificity phosphatase PhoE